MKRRVPLALALVLCLATGALAQSPGDGPVPPADIPFPGADAPPAALAPPAAIPPPPDGAPGLVAPLGETLRPSLLPNDATPYAPPDRVVRTPLVKPPVALGNHLELSAKLTDDGPAIRAGLIWRVFSEIAQPDGTLPMVAEAKGGSVLLNLKPGAYYVYCGFGHSGTTKRVETAGGTKAETMVLNAGGLRLNAVAKKDSSLPPADLSFDIFSLEVDSHGEPKPVALGVHAEEIVRLTSATYNVVANYGNANATTSADIEVKAGKLTDVTLTEKAAKVTMKLVGAPGGEAIADTSWSVLTQAGDLVTTGAGAFPSFVLAEGDYTVIARHGDNQYQRIVTITTGNDTDVEVLATDKNRIN